MTEQTTRLVLPSHIEAVADAAAAVTDFVDPAVDFSLKFQANADEPVHEDHDEAGNDSPASEADDGSNVVSVDFTRKK